MRTLIPLFVAALLVSTAACSSAPSMGMGGGGAGGTTGTSSSSSGSGGDPATPWTSGLEAVCHAVHLVELGPNEELALAVQQIVPPPGQRFVEKFSISFARSSITGGPYKALWAVGTVDGLADAPAVLGEAVFEEADLTWDPLTGGVELAAATIPFDPPLSLSPGDVLYAGMRLEKHAPLPSMVALCEMSEPPFTPDQGDASLFSKSLPGGKVAQCPGDCRLDQLSTFGFPWPLIVTVSGH